MIERRQLVEAFYAEIWNRGDETAVHRLLSRDLAFRGSTGPESSGVEGFLDYVRLIRGALSDFVCVIEEIVCEGDRAFAKMSFAGVHSGCFFGVEATERRITWSGAALFRFRGDEIASLWVLGDVDALKRQLGLSIEVSP